MSADKMEDHTGAHHDTDKGQLETSHHQTGSQALDQQSQHQRKQSTQQSNFNEDQYDGSYKDKSVWLAKKARSDTEKNIELLANRISLLKNEEDRTLQKIQDTRSKTKNILETKKRNEDVFQKKQFNKRNDNEYLNLMQKKSAELRRAQEEERRAIRQALLELKKEETNEIKKQTFQNEKLIQKAKLQQHETRKKKHDKVTLLIDNSRRNIEVYWNERLKFFEEQQEFRRYNHLQEKSKKDLILERLEQEELELIKRLQYSQEIHEQACRELDQVIQMPASEYLKAQHNPTQLQHNNSSVALEQSSLSGYSSKGKQGKNVKKGDNQTQQLQKNQRLPDQKGQDQQANIQ